MATVERVPAVRPAWETACSLRAPSMPYLPQDGPHLCTSGPSCGAAVQTAQQLEPHPPSRAYPPIKSHGNGQPNHAAALSLRGTPVGCGEDARRGGEASRVEPSQETRQGQSVQDDRDSSIARPSAASSGARCQLSIAGGLGGLAQLVHVTTLSRLKRSAMAEDRTPPCSGEIGVAGAPELVHETTLSRLKSRATADDRTPTCSGEIGVAGAHEACQSRAGPVGPSPTPHGGRTGAQTSPQCSRRPCGTGASPKGGGARAPESGWSAQRSPAAVVSVGTMATLRRVREGSGSGGAESAMPACGTAGQGPLEPVVRESTMSALRRAASAVVSQPGNLGLGGSQGVSSGSAGTSGRQVPEGRLPGGPSPATSRSASGATSALSTVARLSAGQSARGSMLAAVQRRAASQAAKTGGSTRSRSLHRPQVAKTGLTPLGKPPLTPKVQLGGWAAGCPGLQESQLPTAGTQKHSGACGKSVVPPIPQSTQRTTHILPESHVAKVGKPGCHLGRRSLPEQLVWQSTMSELRRLPASRAATPTWSLGTSHGPVSLMRASSDMGPAPSWVSQGVNLAVQRALKRAGQPVPVTNPGDPRHKQAGFSICLTSNSRDVRHQAADVPKLLTLQPDSAPLSEVMRQEGADVSKQLTSRPEVVRQAGADVSNQLTSQPEFAPQVGDEMSEQLNLQSEVMGREGAGVQKQVAFQPHTVGRKGADVLKQPRIKPKDTRREGAGVPNQVALHPQTVGREGADVLKQPMGKPEETGREGDDGPLQQTSRSAVLPASPALGQPISKPRDVQKTGAKVRLAMEAPEEKVVDPERIASGRSRGLPPRQGLPARDREYPPDDVDGRRKLGGKTRPQRATSAEDCSPPCALASRPESCKGGRESRHRDGRQETGCCKATWSPCTQELRSALSHFVKSLGTLSYARMGQRVLKHGCPI
eukprot:jgi/Botrbrau1/22416/Bobra.0091s0021.1